MTFDRLQSAWQSSDHGQPPKFSEEVLLREVCRNRRYFEAMVLRRDLVEVMAAIVVTGFFGWLGIQKGDVTLGLAAGVAFGVGTFLVVDRWRQRQRSLKPDDTLRTGIQISLAQVNHQIWLLTNIAWWYLSPIMVAWAVMVGSDVWKHRQQGSTWYFVGRAVYVVVSLVLIYGIYRLNQRAVSKELIPRRDELQSLLASLNEPV